MILYGVILLAIVLADRLIKYWAIHALAPVGELPGISGIFHFYYVENTGAAFSLFSRYTWLLTILTALVVVGVLYLLFFKKLKPGYRLFLSFIAGGGIANLIDRIAFGYVVDYIKIDFITFFDFAIFNLADIFITRGGIGIVVMILFFDRDSQKRKPNRAEGETDESQSTQQPAVADADPAGADGNTPG